MATSYQVERVICDGQRRLFGIDDHHGPERAQDCRCSRDVGRPAFRRDYCWWKVLGSGAGTCFPASRLNVDSGRGCCELTGEQPMAAP